jgi:hypothetical protein
MAPTTILTCIFQGNTGRAKHRSRQGHGRWWTGMASLGRGTDSVPILRTPFSSAPIW